MDLRAPLRSLCPGTHGRVLSALATHDRPLSGNAVAREVGISNNAALRALDDLVAAGVVWRAKPTPRTFLHVLDPEHVLTPVLVELANVEERVRQRLAAHVEPWTPPPASVAIRTPAPGTVDEEGRAIVELLVAVDDAALLADPAWHEAVDGLVEVLGRWTGNQVQLVHRVFEELQGRGPGDGGGEQQVPWRLVAGRAVTPAATPPEPAAVRAGRDRAHGEAWRPGWPRRPTR